MDRLVCGDVASARPRWRCGRLHRGLRRQAGGGAGPTTLLAEQHYQTFADRFADWPVRIAELSRFKSAKGAGARRWGTGEGKVDIIIGTHKLLQKDVTFKRLGLVVIDEEHRFGVRQKEALKRCAAEVDILTLTATPIPRTLGMALEGLREFSVIATAPQKRLAIKTFVQRYSKGIIREAVLRVQARRAGVFPAQRGRDHRERPPGAGGAAARGAHRGRPRPDAERELERVMRDFTPSAPTCCCAPPSSRPASTSPPPTPSSSTAPTASAWPTAAPAARPVGRSHHQAYAYLLTGPRQSPASGPKRLEAIP